MKDGNCGQSCERGHEAVMERHERQQDGQATNDATKETGGSVSTASPAQSVARPKVPIPNHEVGQNGS